MLDPYKVLGVSRDASMDEIKKAYRNLSRKYHPDANINNPNKDQAEEMFKQVQQAYDQIVKERERGQTGQESWYGGFGGGYQSGYQTQDDQRSMEMRAAANYINAAHYQEALNVLNRITERNGEWYYYHAIASAGAARRPLPWKTQERPWNWNPTIPSISGCISSYSTADSGIGIWEPDMAMSRTDRAATAAVSVCA